MKTMIVSDLAALRSMLVQLVGICLVISVFMGVAMGSLAGPAAAIATMVPFMLLFSLAATDEQGGWERFRLTLPLTRRQVAYGRYAGLAVVTAASLAFALALAFAFRGVAAVMPAGILPEGLAPAANPPAAIIGASVAGACVVLIGEAVALPLIMRYGMTKATRIVPLVVVVAIASAVGFLGEGFHPTGVLADLVAWLEAGDNFLFLAAAMLGAAALVYAVSALVAARLYERREL